MMFKCPHCKKKTISLKEKISVGITIPKQCKKCKNYYVSDNKSYFFIGVVLLLLIVYLPNGVSDIVLYFSIPTFFIIFMLIGIFYPVKKSSFKP